MYQEEAEKVFLLLSKNYDVCNFDKFGCRFFAGA